MFSRGGKDYRLPASAWGTVCFLGLSCTLLPHVQLGVHQDSPLGPVKTFVDFGVFLSESCL